MAARTSAETSGPTALHNPSINSDAAELNIPKRLCLGTEADTGRDASHREVVACPMGQGCSDLLAKCTLQTSDLAVCVT